MLLKDIAYLNESMEVVYHQDIRIEGAYIKEIKAHGTLHPVENEEWMDASSLLMMPGLCDAHMHTGQQLLKGRILDAQGMIWKEIMLPFESTLTKDIMRINAQLAALEMIKGGTTSFVDAGSYFMEEAASVYVQSGLRGLLTYSTMDDDPALPDQIQDTWESALKHNDELYDHYHGVGNIKVGYSLRTLLSVSETLIQNAYQHAHERNTILQAHMNEYPKEVEGVIQKFGMRPYEYLQACGVLDDHFLGAHSLLVDEHEIQLIKEAGSHIVLCPFSNCAKALSPYPKLKQADIPLAIGSDGAAHGGLSIWNEMRNLRCMMNVTHGIALQDTRILTSKKLLQMATDNTASFMMEKDLGYIKEGALADAIFIYYHQPHLYPSGNMRNTLVECVNANDVMHSMVHGKWLMKNREVLTLDETTILKEAETIYKQVMR